ncbi:MAG: biotin transporter BioY [Atopobiaceae bacterium]|nr:biotin transporter BioY [Atopobiaceae bacterium]MDD3177433.1 biotin transporter BioY [Atopobiaceae bacterium]
MVQEPDDRRIDADATTLGDDGTPKGKAVGHDGKPKEPFFSTRDIAFSGVSIALLAVSAWVTVSFGPVPFTLQTMVVTFVALALSPRQAMLAICGYVVLGAIGLPVFSGMRGGIGVLAGPTGGSIVGFVVGVALALVIVKAGRTPVRELAAAGACLLASYAFGWAWLMYVGNLTPMAAFAAACAPFIIPDIIKGLVGIALARAVRAAIPGLVQVA